MLQILKEAARDKNIFDLILINQASLVMEIDINITQIDHNRIYLSTTYIVNEQH